MSMVAGDSEVTEAANATQALITGRERQIRAFSADVGDAVLRAAISDPGGSILVSTLPGPDA